MLSLMLVNAHAHYRQASDVFNEGTFHSIASLLTLSLLRRLRSVQSCINTTVRSDACRKKKKLREIGRMKDGNEKHPLGGDGAKIVSQFNDGGETDTL